MVTNWSSLTCHQFLGEVACFYYFLSCSRNACWSVGCWGLSHLETLDEQKTEGIQDRHYLQSCPFGYLASLLSHFYPRFQYAIGYSLFLWFKSPFDKFPKSIQSWPSSFDFVLSRNHWTLPLVLALIWDL